MSHLLPDFIEKKLQAFWILSRKPEIPQSEIDETLRFAEDAGYDPSGSEWLPTDQVKCRNVVNIR